MSNIQLYCKVQNVIMSCKTHRQLNVAKKYMRLSQRILSHEWNMDVLHLMISKERELTCR